MTTALVLSLASVLAAPPPKNVANEGRLILVVGTEGSSFRPDGSDLTTFKVTDLPNGVGQSPYDYRPTPDGKTALAVDHSDGNVGNGTRLDLLGLVSWSMVPPDERDSRSQTLSRTRS